MGKVGLGKGQCCAYRCQSLRRLKSWCEWKEFSAVSESSPSIQCCLDSCIDWWLLSHCYTQNKTLKKSLTKWILQVFRDGIQPARSLTSHQYVWSSQLSGRQFHSTLRWISNDHWIQLTFHLAKSVFLVDFVGVLCTCAGSRLLGPVYEVSAALGRKWANYAIRILDIITWIMHLFKC